MVPDEGPGAWPRPARPARKTATPASSRRLQAQMGAILRSEADDEGSDDEDLDERTAQAEEFEAEFAARRRIDSAQAFAESHVMPYGLAPDWPESKWLSSWGSTGIPGREVIDELALGR